MGLREQARLDARAILEDDSGFAWPVTLTSPLGVATSLRGFTTDVAQIIDPETGQAVAGRRASFAVSRAALPVLPEAVSDASRKPWVATFSDSQGVPATWKVIEVMPDSALGVVVLILEVYQRAIVPFASSSLTLPSRTLAGPVAPAVALAGALQVPGRTLAGSVAPLPVLDGALALPALQASGAVTPAVALAGSPTLPSLALAGTVTPAVALAGSPTLPSLALAGTVTPAVGTLTGSLTLPSLQLSGTLTVGAVPQSAWIRLAASSQSGGEWTPSLVDVRNSNPAVQTDVDRRAAVGASANGLPTAVFDGTDIHIWPLQTAGTGNNGTTQWGLFCFVKTGANVSTRQRILHCTFGSASSAKLTVDITNNGMEINLFRDGSNGRQMAVTSGVVANTWHSIFIGFDGTQSATDALAMTLWINALQKSPSYVNLGAGGAMTTLTPVSSNQYIGASTDSDTPASPLLAGVELGPNFMMFITPQTAAQIAAYDQFERPT